MARLSLLPALLVPALLTGALALAPMPGLAQDAPEAEAAAPHGPATRGAKSPMIRLDFGAGRTISVQCGETAIVACVEAITPLAEKLAATPASGPGKDRDHSEGCNHGKGNDKVPGKDKEHGKDKGEDHEKDHRKGEGKPGAGGEHDKPRAAPDAPAGAPPADAPAPGAPAQ
ncbi:hypothetical protein [Pseudogemmobacter bohemicus]|uniref:hypothetical protein n=1 Tax=Pseudogemmobacter bohemicus TaxID=2250708 RepID=UPI000DD2F754|nr:hypothetical protein [Pseudogemmobacter bohemicus]